MDHFSQELIEELRAYWLKRYRQEISAEEAGQYLRALAELYLCLHEIESAKQKKDWFPRPPAAETPILILD